MQVVKWMILFVMAFFISLILILTFMQPAFKQEVGAQILIYHTRAIPVYFYVLGAFIAGLLIGLLAALFGFITSKTEMFKKNRQIKTLEQELADKALQAQTSSAVSLNSTAPAAAPETKKQS